MGLITCEGPINGKRRGLQKGVGGCGSGAEVVVTVVVEARASLPGPRRLLAVWPEPLQGFFDRTRSARKAKTRRGKQGLQLEADTSCMKQERLI
jgi:hypothetical protein